MLAFDHDVGAPVGERLHAPDQRAQPTVPRAGAPVDARRENAETRSAPRAVREQPAVAGLEDVQREQCAGKEDDAEGEDGQAERHA